MKLKRRILSVLLTLAVMITFMPTVTLTVNAASKTGNKVYTVSSEKNEIGDNTKYTYNKKGFVIKAVSKYTAKDSDSDTTRTVTTTFKYNTKNRIKTKTTKDVSKVTSYKTNRTTGKSTGQSLGTVTTTTTDVTNYTYKNGRATKAVTTSTTVKSGTIKETDVSLNLDEITQLSNGKYIAGYNYRNADGSYNEEDTSDNAYYYTGNIKAAESTGTTTTTYKNNGNGTYTRTETYVSNGSNFTETPKITYYRYDSQAGKYVVCAQTDDYDFARTESVDVAVNTGGSGSSYNTTDTEVITDKTVTTETFKYDTKKRVKQATVTTVATGGTEATNNYNRTYTYKDTEEFYDEASDSYKNVGYTTTSKVSTSGTSKESYTETTSQVEKYTYNKKNRKIKTVITDKGIENRTETYEEGRTDRTEESSTAYDDGKTSSRKYTETYSGGNDVRTIVYSKGSRAETITNNPYSCTEVSTGTNRNDVTSTNETKSDYSFFKDGGRMISTVSKDTYQYAAGNDRKARTSETKSDSTFFKNGGGISSTITKETTEYTDGRKYVENSTSNRYEYDNKSAYEIVYVDTDVAADGTQSAYTSSYKYYNDGTGEKEYYSSYEYSSDPNEKEEYNSDDASLKTGAESVKAAAANADSAMKASGTSYVETKSKAVKAKPSKSTTKYTYDKQGNLKTAKTTGSRSVIETLRNETYGNTIYEFNAEKETEAVETVVAHTYKRNRMKENTVKDGTNRVKTATSTSTYAEDRSTPSYGIGGRVTYTLKSKTIAKKAVRTDVELQQWLIQNPGCGSVAGLF